MIELKIKKKYFDAILELKKPFELRHKQIPKGSIVKLIEIEEPIFMYVGRGATKKSKVIIKTGRYIIFESGECKKLQKHLNCYFVEIKEEEVYYHYAVFFKDNGFNPLLNMDFDWYDNFCWDYINEKQTYLIEIAKIIEVKGN